MASAYERKKFGIRKENEGNFWGQPRLIMREGSEYPRLSYVNPKNIPEQVITPITSLNSDRVRIVQVNAARGEGVERTSPTN